MALVLYRKGNSELVRGVWCESTRIEYDALARHLSAGWVTDPSKLVGTESPVYTPQTETPDIDTKPRRGRKPRQ